MTKSLREALQASVDLLERALPYVRQDAQMMADLSRHAPLDAESQARHDQTTYDSERLIYDIPNIIGAAKEALAAPADERDASYADYQQRKGAPLTFFTHIAAQTYRAAALRDDMTHQDAMRAALEAVERARAQ